MIDFDTFQVQISKRISTTERQIRELFLRLGGIFTQSSDVMGGHGVAGTVPAGTTYYIVPFIPGLDTVGRSTPWPIGGTLKNLYVRTVGAQPGTGTLVFTLYDATAAVSTGIVATVPAGGVSAVYSDTTHTYVLPAGNQIQLQIKNNAAAASAPVGGCAWQIDYGLVP